MEPNRNLSKISIENCQKALHKFHPKWKTEHSAYTGALHKLCESVDEGPEPGLIYLRLELTTVHGVIKAYVVSSMHHCNVES